MDSGLGQRLQQLARPSGPPDSGGQPNLPATFNPDFEERLMALLNAVKQDGGDARVFSGPRSSARQEQMFLAALEKYGDEALAKKFFAKPGESLHEAIAGLIHGLGAGALAADLAGDLNKIYELAPRFGLEFSNKQQPWHVQFSGLKSLR